MQSYLESIAGLMEDGVGRVPVALPTGRQASWNLVPGGGDLHVLLNEKEHSCPCALEATKGKWDWLGYKAKLYLLCRCTICLL